MKEIVDCVYDVDLLNSLQSLLTMSTVREQVHPTLYIENILFPTVWYYLTIIGHEFSFCTQWTFRRLL